MARVVPAAALTGIALLDERISPDTLSAADSTYDQAGGRPGEAEPDDPRSMLRLQLSGREQAEDLTVQVLAAGMPSLPAAMRVGYYPTADGVSALRGWTPPAVLLGWSAGEYAAAASATRGPPGAVTLRETQAVVVAYADSAGGTNSIKSRLYAPSEDAWNGAITVDPEGPAAFDGVVGLAELPSGRVLALVLHAAAANAGRVWYSDDSGGSWSLYADPALDSQPTASDYLRLRLLSSGDDLVAVALLDDAGTKTLYQWVSTSQGARFATAGSWEIPGASADVVALASGRLGCVYLDASGYSRWVSVGSGWDTLETAAALASVSISASVVLAEVAVVVEPDGVVWVYGRGTTAGAVYAWRSDNEGLTWRRANTGPFRSSDSATYPADFAPVAALGRVVLLHRWVGSPGDEDASIAAAQLGGWGTIEIAPDRLPSQPTTDPDPDRVGFGPTTVSGATGTSWLPFDLPADCGWTATGAGAEALASGELQITTTANTRYASAPPTALGTAEEAVLLFQVRVLSGGALATSRIAVEIDLSSGANGHSLALRFDATGFRIRDLVSATDRATITVDTTVRLQVLVGLSVGLSRCFVAYRRPGSAEWTLAYQGSFGLSGAITVGRLEWGNIASGTATSGWSMFCLAQGFPTFDAGGLYQTGAHPPLGRRLTGRAVPLAELSADGYALSLRALDGPARYAEEQAIPARYDYGAERLYPLLSPSPSEGWRSVSDAATFAWRPSEAGVAVDTALGRSRSVVVGFLGVNFRTAYLEAWDGAAWVTLGEYDGATGFTGLTATASGDQVAPNTATTATAGRYLQRGELAGGVALISGSYYPILDNEEGLWTQATTRRPRLTVEGSPTSGSATLIAPRGVLVVHGVNAAYDKFRVRIPSQTTPTGDIRVGALFLGGLVLTGLPWDWGWQDELRPHVEETRDRYGVTRRRQLGPPVRLFSWSWAGGVALQRLRQSSAPDYLSPDASLQPLAAVGDVPWQMAGILRQSRGGERPSIALRVVPLTSTYATITDPTAWVYGRLTGSVNQAHVAGKAGTAELVRVETATVEEIP